MQICFVLTGIFDSRYWVCGVGGVHLWAEYFAALSRLWESSQDFLICTSCIIYMKLIYCIAVYRTVLDPKGLMEGGERKKKERNGKKLNTT